MITNNEKGIIALIEYVLADSDACEILTINEIIKDLQEEGSFKTLAIFTKYLKIDNKSISDADKTLLDEPLSKINGLVTFNGKSFSDLGYEKQTSIEKQNKTELEEFERLTFWHSFNMSENVNEHILYDESYQFLKNLSVRLQNEVSKVKTFPESALPYPSDLTSLYFEVEKIAKELAQYFPNKKDV